MGKIQSDHCQKSGRNTQSGRSRRSSNDNVLIRQLPAAKRPTPNQKHASRNNAVLMYVDMRSAAQRI